MNGWQHPTDGSGVPLGSTPPGALAGLGTTLADKDLPSVMTCANYLKLPPYSCKVRMFVVEVGAGLHCLGVHACSLVSYGWR